MGNPFSIPLDPCTNKIFHLLDEKVGYTRNLEKNLVDLETTMELLRAERDDLLRRVTREEDRGLQRLFVIKVWLNNVEKIEKTVIDLLSARNVQLQRLCLCGFCSKSLIWSYRYGKSVFLTLREVEKLKRSGVFEVVADKAQTSDVEERPLQPTIVGQETMLDEAWKHLMKDDVCIMGMFGMGGVGKTTLLTQLNNKFTNDRCGFDFVIWVIVSKELHVEKIQDEIAQKIGLGGEEWKQKDKTQKGVHLYNFLRKKRFVLFLDDIWEKVDLAEIGVPFPTTQNRCKVAFTTRSQDVCGSMGVEDPMEVQCLREHDAFDLFQKNVGQITLGSDPEIPNLAKIVARKCHGLPLALNVIGETMSSKRTIQEWHHAIEVLTSYATKFKGMKDKILPLLKYSYDNLEGKEVKSCLLYCALFPEDDSILNEELIDYWTCEGIIDGSHGIERADNTGYEIIGRLVRASLLMEDESSFLRMHDVVREMALWIASDLGKKKEAFIVRAGVGLKEMPKVENWKVVRKMSLMKNQIHQLAGSPECLELTTLLLQKANLENISSQFFRSMPRLVVLNLSRNEKLSELPVGISKLGSLQYLNLSHTPICHLPICLQELKKLTYLDLEYTRKLSNIVGISSLHNLKVLKLYCSGFSWDLGIVDELETLENLEILTRSYFGLPSDLENFLSSPKLTSCIFLLEINDFDMESSGIALPVTMDKLGSIQIKYSNMESISLPVTMDKLHNINIEFCSLGEIKMVSPLQNPRYPCFLSLSKVYIRSCECLKELTLLMFAPKLRNLHVSLSHQLEDIIKKEKACEGEELGIVPFPNLVSLKLERLANLKSVYWRPLPFPCLKKIRVSRCRNLKKLPLDFKSGENGLIIEYSEREWLEGVEWEDEATKSRFLSSCKEV